jgi:hypothetical protein
MNIFVPIATLIVLVKKYLSSFIILIMPSTTRKIEIGRNK